MTPGGLKIQLTAEDATESEPIDKVDYANKAAEALEQTAGVTWPGEFGGAGGS